MKGLIVDSRKSTKTLQTLFCIIFAIFVAGFGIYVAVESSKTATILCSAYATDDGTTYNELSGGTISISGNSASTNPNRTFQLGSLATLEATANEGYSFLGFYSNPNFSEDSIITTDYKYEFVVSENEPEIYANFAKNYNITFQIPTQTRTLEFTRPFPVGTTIEKSDVINLITEQLDPELASEYENITLALSDSEDSSLANNITPSTFRVGPTATALSITPAKPEAVGIQLTLQVVYNYGGGQYYNIPSGASTGCGVGFDITDPDNLYTLNGRSYANTGNIAVNSTKTWSAYCNDGFTFEGWYTENALNDAYLVSNSKIYSNIQIGYTMTRYAFFTAKYFTITGTMDSSSRFSWISITADSGDNDSAFSSQSDTSCSVRAYYGTWISLSQSLNDGYTLKQYSSTSSTLPANMSSPWNSSGFEYSLAANLSVKFESKGINYYVAYNENGGTGTMSRVPHTYGTAQNLTANTFSRTGYEFAGWNTKDDGTGTSYSDGVSVKNLTTVANRTINLYAQWTANTYIISYNLNDGAVSGNPTTYTFSTSQQTKTITQPTRTGYDFSGWSVSGASINGSTLTIPANTTGTITLTATWSAAVYNIGYTLNSGTNGTGNPTTYTFNSAQQTKTINNPTRTGHNFSGWTVNNGASITTSGTTRTLTIPANTTGQIKLTAGWTAASYAINYTLNDGTNGTGNPTSYTFSADAQNLTINNPTRDGYFFTGWNVNNGTSITTSGATRTLTIPANTTGAINLEATWQVADVNITLHDNNGNGGSGTVISTYGIAMRTPINLPSRTGYTFDGYWTSSDSGTTFIKQYYTDLGASANNGDFLVATTLYAKWTANQYTIILDNGEGVANGSVTATYNENLLDCTPPSKTGYTFLGYFDNANEPIKYYNANGTSARGDSFKWTFTDGATLYAHWEIKYCEVSITGSPNDVWQIVLYNNADPAVTIGTYTENTTVNVQEGNIIKISASITDDSYYLYSLQNENDTDIINNEYVEITADYEIHLEARIKTYELEFNLDENSSLSVERRNSEHDSEELVHGGDVTVFTEYGKQLNITPSGNQGYNLSTFTIEIFNGEVKDTSIPDVTISDLAEGSYTLIPTYENGVTIKISVNSGAKTFMIIYNSNGGTGSMAPQTGTYDSPLTLSANAFQKTDCEFLGWNYNITFFKVYDDEDNLTVEEINDLITDVDNSKLVNNVLYLYAIWVRLIPIEITVEHYFEKIGVSGDSLRTDYIIDNTKTQTLSELDGETLYFGSEYTIPLLSGEAITGFTARSEAIPSVLEGGERIKYYYTRNSFDLTTTAGTGILATSGNGTYDYGEIITLNALVKNGYSQGKWMDGVNVFSTTLAYTGTMPNNDLDLEAIATAKNFNIAFNANEATGSMLSQSATYDSEITLTDNTFEYNGFTFLGWATNDDGEVVFNNSQRLNIMEINSLYDLATDISGTLTATLYAKWVNAGDCDLSITSTTAEVIVKYDDALTTLSAGAGVLTKGSIIVVTYTPSSNNYISSSTINGVPFKSGDKFKVSGNVTITVSESTITPDFTIVDQTITGYSGSATNIVLPSTYNFVNVEKVGKNAFKNKTGLLSVEIPSTITEIESNAFNGCSNLQTIIIRNTTNIKIGSNAFGTLSGTSGRTLILDNSLIAQNVAKNSMFAKRLVNAGITYYTDFGNILVGVENLYINTEIEKISATITRYYTIATTTDLSGYNKYVLKN